MPVTALESLAEGIAALTPERIPEQQHRQARLRLIDTLGLIAAAADHAAGQSLRAWAAANPGAGATVIVSGRPASPAVAALVHGSLAHARDFDDTFADTVIHPGSTIIAATLAVAEETDAPFAAVSSAITIGYEVAARLGAVAGRKFHARGFHATGLIGPIAAAAAAGHVIGLDAARLADAMGLATSMSSGLLAFLGDGGWSKWMHTGWSAHGGIVAAQLAAHGFRGPRQALDHRYGLYGAFLGEAEIDLSAVTAGLGKSWRGDSAQAKLYPCAHVIQPYIDAALALRESDRALATSLKSLRCILAPWAMPIVGEPRDIKTRPRNDLEAIASLPFMVAAALIDGRVDLRTLEPATIQREDLRSLASRIHCEADASLGSGFDGRMEFAGGDGRQQMRAVGIVPLAEERIIAKFRANTAGRGQAACEALLQLLRQNAPGGRELVAAATAALVTSETT
jgi:2-methylcitrate dehydratase PrpD